MAFFVVPIIVLIICRVMCAKANYYCNVTEQKRIGMQKSPIKFYNFNKLRFFVISVFCEHKTIARRVAVCAVLSFAVSALILAAALLFIYLNTAVYLIISCALAAVLIVTLLCFANFNDTSVWTSWGTPRR